MALPILLPPTAIAPHLRKRNKEENQDPFSHLEWQPKRHLTDPQPPSNEDSQLQEDFIQKQALEGKIVKKTRPRRTVDYNGGVGRWILSRKLRPNPTFTPYMRPAPPFIIDLLPAKAYPDNASTSLCTKFVHTSTNKIRCPVNVVTWTPEARRVLTGSTSGEFTLWNGLTFNFETILQAHDTAITAMEFTHSGSYLASTDKSGVIKYFEPNMNNLTAWQGTNTGNREAIRGLSFSPDDQRFVTASDDASLRIWSFKESRGENVLSGHGWDVKCVEWHPTKGLIVSGSKDSSVKFWDPRTGTCLSTLHQHKNTIQTLSWSPNGNQLATGSRDQTVRVFDIRAMKEFRILKGHKKEVCSVAWHPVHPIIVSGGSEGSIFHWDLSSADMVDSFGPPTLVPPPVPATSSKSGSGRNLKDVVSPLPIFAGPTPTSAPRATLSQAHDSNVWALTYHPLGHILVSASNDHTTRFWSRERPGDKTSVFAAGGEKPPEEMGGGDEGEEEDGMGGMSVPGFGFGSGGGGGLPGMGGGPPAAERERGPERERGAGRPDISGGWWREPTENASNFNPSSSSNYDTQGGHSSRPGPIPTSTSPNGGPSSIVNSSYVDSSMNDDFAIPGFGGGGSSAAPSSSGPYNGSGGGQYTDRPGDEFGRDMPPRGREGEGERDAFGRDIRGGGDGGSGGYSGYGGGGDDGWSGGRGGGPRGGRDDWGGGDRRGGYGQSGRGGYGGRKGRY